MEGTEEIPSPPGYPVVGHLGLIDSARPTDSMVALAHEYGSIYRLRFPGRTVVVASSWELAHELSDERRFPKKVGPVLKEVGNAIHNSLFAAENGHPDWEKAHR